MATVTSSTQGGTTSSNSVMKKVTAEASSTPTAFADFIKPSENQDNLTVCRWSYHQSAIIQNRLYIIGGLATFMTNDIHQTHFTTPNPFMYEIDLSKSIDVQDNSSKTLFWNTTAGGGNAISNSGEGTLWADEYRKRLYLLPGTGMLNLAGQQVWDSYVGPENSEYLTYDINFDVWEAHTPDLQGFGPYFSPGQGGVWVSDPTGGKNGTGYLLGGQGVTDKDVLPGNLITYNSQADVWKNETTSSGSSQRYQAQLVHVPGVGEDGILVALGGMNSSSNAQAYPFDTVDVYDISTKKWYRQATSGDDIPKVRGNLCTVLTSASDKSSHNIAIFGGGLTNSAFSGVSVLSLPSFRWFAAAPEATDHLTGAGVQPGQRDGVTCHKLGGDQGRYLMSVGGHAATKDVDMVDQPCDVTGLYLFDLSKFAWVDTYDTAAEAYQVPTAIQRVIGGDGSGTATMTEPQATGFDDDGLKAVFQGTAAVSASLNTTSAATTATATSISHILSLAPSPLSTAAKTGAIIGGVVGLLMLVSLGVFIFLRRRRKMFEQGKGDFNEWEPNYIPEAVGDIEYRQPAEADGKGIYGEMDGGDEGLYGEMDGGEAGHEVSAFRTPRCGPRRGHAPIELPT